MASKLDFGNLVVCGVDINRDWRTVVQHALRYARAAGASLQIVYAIEPPGTVVSRLFEGQEAKAEIDRHCRELEAETLEAARELVQGQCDVGVTVKPGRAAAVVLELSQQLGAGLVVLGAGAWEGWNRLFVGSTADRVLRHSSVPVLISAPTEPKPIKRILVPTDLDRADEGAARVALRIASLEKARVSILHAYGLPTVQHRYMGNLAALRRELKREARQAFEEYVEGIVVPDGAKPLHKLLIANPDEDRPADSIIDACERLNMDLIVMALGGISILQSLVIGAVAERLIRDLPCDLLALPTRWAKRH